MYLQRSYYKGVKFRMLKGNLSRVRNHCKLVEILFYCIKNNELQFDVKTNFNSLRHLNTKLICIDYECISFFILKQSFSSQFIIRSRLFERTVR